MPIYEFECRKCGHVFDVMQSFSAPPPTTCAKGGCRGKVRKVLSPPAVIFKGSGFYCTDYAKGKNGKGSSKKAEEIGKVAESTTDTKSTADSKSATESKGADG
jgi:putative FmdB family regulatory protein